MEKFGLKIRLRKVNPNYNKGIEKKPMKEIIAFGHYDAMAIEPIKALSDFRPGKDVESADVRTEKYYTDKYYTEYTLKLVAVDSKKLSDDNKNEYGYWSNFGKNAFNIDIDLPFLAVVSVDIKDDKLNKPKKLQRYQDLICNLCDKKDNKVSIAPYLCLGYTDFVILVRSRSLKAIIKYIVGLRNKADISSTYSVFGLLKGYNADYIGNAQISARFEWSLKEITSDENLPDFFKNLPYGVTFGVFDCYADRLLSERDFYKLFNEFSPYFKDGSRNNLIKNFNTYLNYRDGDTNTGIEGNGESSKKSKSSVDKDIALVALNKFLQIYKELIDKTQSHKRLYTAMKEMGRFYGYIISTCHSQDVRKVFGGFYSDFLSSLTKIVEDILVSYINKNKSDGKIDKSQNIAEQIEKLNEAIEKFRTLFGDLLFDILRSDHSFFEAPSVAHPSIGSTTKLLLAYNNIVNDWNKKIGTENGHHYVSFLVTSGGCDVTQAHNLLFNFEGHIKPKGEDKKKYKLPVIITIPEASLYDVEGTLFRLAHEFFHLKGERNREGRFNHFYKGLFYEYIDYCCHYILDESVAMFSGDVDTSSPATIAAIDFKDKIEKDKFKSKEYDTLYSLVKEFESSKALDNGDLKNYSEIIHDGFNAVLFTPQNAYGVFKKALGAFCDATYDSCSLEELYKVFVNNFKINGKLKKIDAYNDNICQLFDKAFKDYESQAVLFGEDKAIENLERRLFDIFKYVPCDMDSYLERTATYIPQLIGELGDFYANIEYEKKSDIRESNVKKLGLIYNYYDGGKEEFNVKGFEEYKEANGSGIKNLPAESDFYSRLWLRATIAFFQGADNLKLKGSQDIDIPLNFNGYENLLVSLYKECFADACALNSLKSSFGYKDDDLIALYLSSFIFEHRNFKQFFGIIGDGEDFRITYLFAMRIAVVIKCVCSNDEDNGDLLKFNSVAVAIGILKRIIHSYTQADENGKLQENNLKSFKLAHDIKKILNDMKHFFNQESDDIYQGFGNYIYIEELIKYVKSGLEGEIGEKNIIQYPNFSKDLTDEEKVDSLFDWWLKSYNKQAKEGKK